MPRIPTRDRLRQGVPRPGGAIVRAPRELGGPAIRNAGDQLVGIARHRQAQAEQEERDDQHRAALELAIARSQWTSGLFEERRAHSSDHNPDHASWTKSYRSRATALQNQAAGIISDRQVRRRFIAETTGDLEQVGAGIARQARDAEMHARLGAAEQALQRQVEVAAIQPDEDAKRVMGGVRASLQDMVDSGIIPAEEAAGRSVAYAQHYASLKAAQLTREDPSLAVSVLSSEPPGPARLIRQLHRFHPTPYWQDGANRAGYGSDTITREDGTVVQVSPGMTVARADAERDLQRRVAEVRARIAKQVGGRLFDRLESHVQAVLVSVAYTTGSLPDAVATAARSNDVEAIAASIAASADGDAGTEEPIRREQAAIVRDQPVRPAGQRAGRPSWADMLAPEQRTGLLEAARSEVERADAARALSNKAHAWQVAHAVRSDVRSAYSAGGAGEIDPADVLQQFGPGKQQQWLEARQHAADVAAKSRNLPTLPDLQIREMVEAHRPQQGDEREDYQQRIHDRVARRADEILRERRDNPARAALRVPTVRRALADAQDPVASSPEKVQALVRELVATQSALGIAGPSMAPVPDQWALEIAAAVSGHDGGTADTGLGTYAGIRQQFGEFADDVIAYSMSRTGKLRRQTLRHTGGLPEAQQVGEPRID